MRRLHKISALVTGAMISVATSAAFAHSMSDGQMNNMNPMVGGHAMFSDRNIVMNAVNSDDNKILVSLVKKAGLVGVLESAGPFTVFAPTDAAFMELPRSTVDALEQPKNAGLLKKVLTYHVVKGRYDFAKLADAIQAGGGVANLTTVEGDKLRAKMNGPRNIILIDDKGHVAHISTYDVYQSNGVINVIDHVLMP